MDYDIIIIGGGPSGLATALYLQQIAPHLAPRTLLLEKEQYPRFKLCAGGLTIDAEAILTQLHLNIEEVAHTRAEAIHFDFEARGLVVRVPKRHALRVVRRAEFDHWLAGKARARGLEIRERITVTNILPTADGVTVETDQGTLRAKVVVGADGSNGITRRCILPHANINTARALEVLTSAYPEPHPRAQQAYFDFFAVPENIAGYVWDFPTLVNGQAMRCWGIYDTNLLASAKRPALKEPLAQEMARQGFDLKQYELKGHPIRWYSPENVMAVPRVLFVGDAAGADPLFGEGISMALGYGALAAHEISAAFQRRDFSFRRYRQRVVRSGLGRTLIARWLIASIIYSVKWRWFQILLWRWLQPVTLLVAWVFVLRWGRGLQRLAD